MDSDEITISKKHKPSDFVCLTGGIISKINFKMMFILFLIYIFIHNDVFINRVLTQIDNKSSKVGPCPTTRGTIILGIILVLVYITVDSLRNFI